LENCSARLLINYDKSLFVGLSQMLDENVHLIQTIQDYQANQELNEAMK
jgi:hypothetical protein